MGLTVTPEVLRTRVAAPSVCCAAACILLAAADVYKRQADDATIQSVGNALSGTAGVSRVQYMSLSLIHI